MKEIVETRILEWSSGEWVVQFFGGLNGWTTFSEVFETEEEAKFWLKDQIDNADLG